MRLTESILKELNRQDIMSDQNVIDIMNAFSSRQNLNYKIEGNQAEYEDGTIIKFVLNDDDEIEYYFINSQGDASRAALVYDWSLLDSVTESTLKESDELKDLRLSDEELTNLYLMDRVLRCMNDESALSDGWLMNYIADGDSDYGADYIIDEYRDFMTKEDYEDAYNYYKELVKSTLDSGIISREYYRGKHGFKPNAGATKKEIQFVKKDFPNIKVISK